VQEIQRGIGADPAAVDEFNRAAAPDEAQMAREGVGQEAEERGRKVLCNVCKEKGRTDGPCAACGNINTPADAKPIPPELVSGWAAFVGEWRTALRSFEGSDYIGGDVDTKLESFSDRVADFQKRFAPYIRISAEVPRYREDTSGLPGWVIAAGVAVPVLVGGVTAGYFALKGKIHDYLKGKSGDAGEGEAR